MNRRSYSAACLMTLVLTAAAWGQSGFLNPANESASSDPSATAADTSVTGDQQPGVKQQLRSAFAQLVTDEIHNFFGELRTALGLPAEPTDPTTDPLAILETAITEMVVNKLTN
jgi:hypothetical protein